MDLLSLFARRRLLIDIARRHIRPGSGSSLEFLTTRTANMKWPDLTNVLSPIPCAVVGAVATRLYMPERVTQDLDVVIAIQDLSVAYQKLLAAGFTREGPLAIGGDTWRTPDGEKIDILEGRETWWHEAIQAAQSNRDAEGLPILPLPFLVLMKYQASRVQDLADIARMLGQADVDRLVAVRELFTQYLPGEMEDLESLIQLGRLEYG